MIWSVPFNKSPEPICCGPGSAIRVREVMVTLDEAWLPASTYLVRDKKTHAPFIVPVIRRKLTLWQRIKRLWSKPA